MKRLKTLSGCLIALLLTSGIGFSETYQSVKIAADKLNVRQDMSIESPVLGSLNQETIVKTTSLENGWYAISYAGSPAYISADYVEVTEDYILGTITGQQVNLRDRPSTEDSQILSSLSLTDIQVHAKNENWYKVTTIDGLSGYVFGDFVTTKTDSKAEVNLEKNADTFVLNGDYPIDLINIAQSNWVAPMYGLGKVQMVLTVLVLSSMSLKRPMV